MGKLEDILLKSSHLRFNRMQKDFAIAFYTKGIKRGTKLSRRLHLHLKRLRFHTISDKAIRYNCTYTYKKNKWYMQRRELWDLRK